MPSSSSRLKNKLIIVESPAKARTIQKILKDDSVIVEACLGHVRDLPNSVKEIPKEYKSKPWASLGIDINKQFKPLYVIHKEKKPVLSKLKKILKECSELYLATDEDREGESISWHLLEILKPKVPVKRMVFLEITSSAIHLAFANTREININLVNAQEARRLVDRLYGYTLSPLLWKKIAYGLSAGRVQSAGLRMLVEREEERLRFKRSYYCGIEASVKVEETLVSFSLIEWQGKKIVTSRHIDPYTGSLISNKNLHWLSIEEAEKWSQNLKKAKATITEIVSKKTSLEPAAPFITSTLQQEANRHLGLSSKETMKIAQSLYEEGYITYMRTDSPSLSEEAKMTASQIITKVWGKELLNENPRYFKKTKGAQEAHEAIRPTGNFETPEKIPLSGAARSLYELIYQRTLASLMKPALKETTKYILYVQNDFIFSTAYTIVVDLGFLHIYPEKDKEIALPYLKKGETFTFHEVFPQKHETKPPSRYTEAVLISKLEKEGIGRPSTYASIISVLLERNYSYKVGQTLIPTFMGMAVVKMLKNHFQKLVDYHFTSTMEDDLDKIAIGDGNKETYLSQFYLGNKGLKSLVEQRESDIKVEESRLVWQFDYQSQKISVKVNRSGAYLAWYEKENLRTLGLDLKTAPSDITEEQISKLKNQQEQDNTILGIDPQTNLPVYFKKGRYGPYLQVGESSQDNIKPKTLKLPYSINPENLQWEDILKELSLPRLIGNHPETQSPILAKRGPFGSFLSYEDLFLSLRPEEKIHTITLEEALELIEIKKQKDLKNTVKNFGFLGNPAKEFKIIKKGRFGLFLKKGNESFPLGKTISSEEVSQWTCEKVLSLWEDYIVQKTKKKKQKSKRKS